MAEIGDDRQSDDDIKRIPEKLRDRAPRLLDGDVYKLASLYLHICALRCPSGLSVEA